LQTEFHGLAPLCRCTCTGMTPAQYCAQKAAPRGSNLHYSLLFLPTDRREAITALHAFRRELADAVSEASDPGVAVARLHWWRNELSTALSGRPQHPVMKALTPAIARHALPHQYLAEIIAGAQMDLDYNRYPDFATLEGYCQHVSGVVAALSAKVLGYTEPATLEFAGALGVGLELVRIIRDAGHDVRRNHIYIPLDELERFGLNSDDLIALREDERVERLMGFQIERAQSYLARAEAGLSGGDRRAQRAHLIMAGIERALLGEIAGLRGRTLNQRIALTPLRKLWIAWRTWMRG
jgi:phytoene synthase